MNYYIYENWQADHHKARIHFANCRSCNNGKGVHSTASEEHGKWIGPCETYEAALTTAVATGGQVSKCKYAIPINPHLP